MNLDIDALETSFDQVVERGDELVDVFFRRLFAEIPSVQPLFFATDMRRLKALLLDALVLLRRSLRDLDTAAPTLRGLGARHVRYGARSEHYPVIGEALIASMAEIAGDAWTVEHEKSWIAIWDVLSSAMLDGADAGGHVVRPIAAFRGPARLATAR